MTIFIIDPYLIFVGTETSDSISSVCRLLSLRWTPGKISRKSSFIKELNKALNNRIRHSISTVSLVLTNTMISSIFLQNKASIKTGKTRFSSTNWLISAKESGALSINLARKSRSVISQFLPAFKALFHLTSESEKMKMTESSVRTMLSPNDFSHTKVLFPRQDTTQHSSHTKNCCNVLAVSRKMRVLGSGFLLWTKVSAKSPNGPRQHRNISIKDSLKMLWNIWPNRKLRG